MKSAPIRVGLAVLAVIAAMPAAAATKSVAGKAAPKAAARQNWLRVSSRTAEGAIVIGNPAAKLKLVEYLSLTCPHCALMSGESMEPLKRDYIARGLVSFEVRHAVRDGYDFVASLLSRCGPPADYLDAMETLFATQGEWESKAMAVSDDPDFEKKSPAEKMAFAAHAAGFDSFFAKRGMTPKAYAACLADAGAQKQLGQMAAYAWERDKIAGTPSFVLNGVPLDGLAHWADLEAQLKAGLR